MSVSNYPIRKKTECGGGLNKKKKKQTKERKNVDDIK